MNSLKALLDVQQMNEADRLTATSGISGVALMKNAGRSLPLRPSGCTARRQPYSSRDYQRKIYQTCFPRCLGSRAAGILLPMRSRQR